METPQADYGELKGILDRVRNQGASSDDLKRAEWLLHRLRPRGVKLTAVAIVEKDGEYLCCTRKVDVGLPVGERRVCFPGGHVDPEDFEGPITDVRDGAVKAALRELKEETGLVGKGASHPWLSYIDECGNLNWMVEVYGFEGEIKPEAGTECLWLPAIEVVRRAAFPRAYIKAFDHGLIA